MLCENSKEKMKIPFAVNYPKSLCCQKNAVWSLVLQMSNGAKKGHFVKTERTRLCNHFVKTSKQVHFVKTKGTLFCEIDFLFTQVLEYTL